MKRGRLRGDKPSLRFWVVKDKSKMHFICQMIESHLTKSFVKWDLSVNSLQCKQTVSAGNFPNAIYLLCPKMCRIEIPCNIPRGAGAHANVFVLFCRILAWFWLWGDGWVCMRWVVVRYYHRGHFHKRMCHWHIVSVLFCVDVLHHVVQSEAYPDKNNFLNISWKNKRQWHWSRDRLLLKFVFYGVFRILFE